MCFHPSSSFEPATLTGFEWGDGTINHQTDLRFISGNN